jgi:tetratricopeptide (TPR) repeat protein
MIGWLRQLDHGVPTDDIIDDISTTLRTANERDRNELASHRETFLVIAKREREALQFLDQMIEEDPEDVRLLIRKANINLFFLGDMEEALRCIDAALELAYRVLFFRREALGVKARILLKLGRGDELSDVLEEIMSLQIVKGIPDIGRERDFVDRAPLGLIRKSVLDRYNEFRPKRPEDTSRGEPPRFEPPDDAS